MAPKIALYDDIENPEIWLKMFKRSMEKVGRRENEYLGEIAFLLRGSASRWFYDNEKNFKDKYLRFESRFIEKYHKDLVIYESKLLTMKYK